MPLVILCGYPASGKTKFAEALKNHLEENFSDYKVSLINDESLGLSKKIIYQSIDEYQDCSYHF